MGQALPSAGRVNSLPLHAAIEIRFRRRRANQLALLNENQKLLDLMSSGVWFEGLLLPHKPIESLKLGWEHFLPKLACFLLCSQREDSKTFDQHARLPVNADPYFVVINIIPEEKCRLGPVKL